MSYLTPTEVRLVEECRAHRFCALCDRSRIERMMFRKKHGVDPDSIRIKTCPVCGRMYTDRPAVSRREGVGEICPDCGTREALEDYEKHKEGQT